MWTFIYLLITTYCILVHLGGQAIFKRLNGVARKVQSQLKGILSEYNLYSDVAGEQTTLTWADVTNMRTTENITEKAKYNAVQQHSRLCRVNEEISNLIDDMSNICKNIAKSISAIKGFKDSLTDEPTTAPITLSKLDKRIHCLYTDAKMYIELFREYIDVCEIFSGCLPSDTEMGDIIVTSVDTEIDTLDDSNDESDSDN